MKKVTTQDRLKYIMNLRGLKQVDILRLCEPYSEKYNIPINKSDLSQYVSGKVEPAQFKLTILSKALNVSPTWLIGYDVPMTNEKEATEVTSKKQELLDLISQMNPEQQQIVIDLIKSLLNKW